MFLGEDRNALLRSGRLWQIDLGELRQGVHVFPCDRVSVVDLSWRMWVGSRSFRCNNLAQSPRKIRGYGQLAVSYVSRYFAKAATT